MIVIPIGTNWGIGPSLLYMFGMLGALIYVSWPTQKSKKKKQARDEIEATKAAIFHDALMQAAGKKNLSCAHARAAHNRQSTPTPLGDSTDTEGSHATSS